MVSNLDIRDIAVIAHVDHGKTTLIDAMLKQTHTFRNNQAEMEMDRIMDSNDLEREKGITIMAKNTAVVYKGVKINIIDTPGHADFGGEVERVLGSADAALLIVDAAEGPLSQTKFVLKQALEKKLKIIVVINKIDRKDTDLNRTKRMIDDLFLDLATDGEGLDFGIIYAIGREGKSWSQIPVDMTAEADLTPLFEMIINLVPRAVKDEDKAFTMLVTAFENNAYLGKLAIGRIKSGRVAVGQNVRLLGNNKSEKFKVEKLYVNQGIEKVEVDEAGSGEIIYLAGNSKINIGETIADLSVLTALPTVWVSPPTIKSSFAANTSVFAKSESKFLTSREVLTRLKKECDSDLGLRVEDNNGQVMVMGRGELHLAILIEKMRREGFALEIGKPEVITKIVDGQVQEPFCEMIIISNQQFIGQISEEMGKRKAKLLKMENMGDEIKMTYEISERNALGLRTRLMTDCRGAVAISSLFVGYQPELKGQKQIRNGVLIASQSGKALSYGLDLAQKRGITFVAPTEEVYEGQIVGLRPMVGDLEINVCKGKQLTNMRSAGNDDAIILAPPVKYSLEECLGFIESDELVDVTSREVRLRKKLLTKIDRTRQNRSG